MINWLLGGKCGVRMEKVAPGAILSTTTATAHKEGKQIRLLPAKKKAPVGIQKNGISGKAGFDWSDVQEWNGNVCGRRSYLAAL